MTNDTPEVPFDHSDLGFKAGLLTTLIGPAAGLFALFMIPLFEGTASSTYLSDFLFSFVPMLGFAYLFGFLPALAAGIVWGSYISSGAGRQWLVGLLIGALAPPLCGLAWGLYQFGLGKTVEFGSGLFGSAAVGLSAAVLTELPIYLILRRSFANAGVSGRQD
jgi:hypothetical protein